LLSPNVKKIVRGFLRNKKLGGVERDLFLKVGTFKLLTRLRLGSIGLK
jgi:hypothetical protein